MEITNDLANDIAVRITEKLIKLGYVRDCTDTDLGDEFEVQDVIVETLFETLNIK